MLQVFTLCTCLGIRGLAHLQQLSQWPTCLAAVVAAFLHYLNAKPLSTPTVAAEDIHKCQMAVMDTLALLVVQQLQHGQKLAAEGRASKAFDQSQPHAPATPVAHAADTPDCSSRPNDSEAAGHPRQTLQCFRAALSADLTGALVAMLVVTCAHGMPDPINALQGLPTTRLIAALHSGGETGSTTPGGNTLQAQSSDAPVDANTASDNANQSNCLPSTVRVCIANAFILASQRLSEAPPLQASYAQHVMTPLAEALLHRSSKLQASIAAACLQVLFTGAYHVKRLPQQLVQTLLALVKQIFEEEIDPSIGPEVKLGACKLLAALMSGADEVAMCIAPSLPSIKRSLQLLTKLHGNRTEFRDLLHGLIDAIT